MIFDKAAPFQERSQALYELTLGKKAARQHARRVLLQIALDQTETVEIRHSALCHLSVLFSNRSTRPLLPLLLDKDAPWELRAEAAHVLGMASEHRPFAIRALKSAWKTAPPQVRFYIAYALAKHGGQQAIPLLRESINDYTPAPDLWWTLAQECRWAILCCRDAIRDGASDPEDPAFLSPAWEQETQFFRAKGRRLFPRNCR
ncbi:HEAT repeat domain-containing protein [Armatimonas sp.]|uniref:HEAT repeat domain-containing protein n=1 Tax=Armatimonas sp. TaxID=1872638 RepID=UPI00374C9061